MPALARGALIAAALLTTTTMALAQDRVDARTGSAMPIASVREVALEGDFVTIQGLVVRVRTQSNLFMIQDDTGEMLVRIPNHLQREFGAPEEDERIRVTGKYGHKTFMDAEGAQQGPADGGERTWGVRVQRLARNLSGGFRNPSPADAAVPTPAPSTAGSPAAMEKRAYHPKASEDLKTRMSTARQRVIASERVRKDARAEHARALREGLQGPELEGILARSAKSEQDFNEAFAEIPPLVEEAREAGLDDGVIRMYEAGMNSVR
jgi:uncharacterized protein YdeI (BOF family)